MFEPAVTSEQMFAIGHFDVLYLEFQFGCGAWGTKQNKSINYLSFNHDVISFV